MFLALRLRSDSERRADARQMSERRRLASRKATTEPLSDRTNGIAPQARVETQRFSAWRFTASWL